VREVHSLREVLPEQAVGILIGTTLPGVLRIAEVHRDVLRQGEAFVVGHLFGTVPSQRLVPTGFTYNGRRFLLVLKSRDGPVP